MGSITTIAMKNRKKSRELVVIPDKYANFAKIAIAPKEAAETNIKQIPNK
jgi:hypothetical protein